jgi:hypothetical protein
VPLSPSLAIIALMLVMLLLLSSCVLQAQQPVHSSPGYLWQPLEEEGMVEISATGPLGSDITKVCTVIRTFS